MLHIFIDANIYLDFYFLPKSDIGELNKLIALIDQANVVLFFTDQIRDEIRRNRDTKIRESIEDLRKQSFKIRLPAICRDYPEATELKSKETEINKLHAELFSRLTSDIDASELNADKFISALFTKAKLIETTDIIYENALRRFHVGNPPGKKKQTLGDEINWESLLDGTPDGKDLYFISADSDYASAINPQQMNHFLTREWRRKKKSDVLYYNTLQSFFKDKFPQIQIAADVEKFILIDELSKSINFATTHLLIAKLSNFDDFNTPQSNQLVDILRNNTQVNLVFSDDDVFGFYGDLIKKSKSKLSANNKEYLENLIAENTAPIEAAPQDNVPF